MKTILVLFAHPKLHRSVANRTLFRAITDLEAVTPVDLYAEYPDFDIDIDREQARLRDHDVIVFQHPVYWYSAPAILKEWQDLVLEYGFAYGSGGLELAGKLFFNAVTTAGRHAAYDHSGEHHFEIRELFTPFEQMANLCRMTYLPPFVLYGAGHANEDDSLQRHAQNYVRLLRALAEDRVDVALASRQKSLSDPDQNFITDPREG